MVKYVTNPKKIYAFENSDGGFTYIEALISLSIMSVIVMLTPSLMKFFNDIVLPEDNFDGDLFIVDLIELDNETEKITVSDDNKNIIFKTNKGNIKYRLHNERIVRSVDDKGFVTMMFNVEDFKIKEVKEGFQLTVKSTGGFYETIFLSR